MKMKILPILFCVVLISCKKKSGETPEPAGTTVYMSGFSIVPASNIAYACYWKNGTVVPLTSTTATGSDATAEDIFVQGTDVYVVGGEKSATGFYVARYWKNGVL
ncbi:MAG TPA: hypothetical protein PLO99_09770, partial [Chitinophagaceae bacterium]|nr:hypothetical protein [Chitinophagaceae bacterium]